MRVAHLIPASFNYFDDIKQEAFALVEAENDIGIAVEVFTLQYGTPGRPRERAAVESVAPSRRFGGMAPWPHVLGELEQFDVVHIHCPFFGALKKIIAWKRAHPKIPLVVTIYRSVIITDLFSRVVQWYNRLYLPGIVACADVVAVPTLEHLTKKIIDATRMLVTVDYSPHFQKLDLSHGVDGKPLKATERLAHKYALVYHSILPDVTPKI